MSYYKIMKRVEEKIAQAKPTKRPSMTGRGLLARSALPTGPLRGVSDDITTEIADYISAIRKQKEELMNGE